MSQVDTKPSVRQDTKPYPFPLPEEDEEELEISAGLGQGYVWAMKIPRFLLEQWERLPEPGVELATLVVDNSSAHTPCTPSPAYSVRAVPPRITLRLPCSESTPTTPADDPMNGRNEAGPSKRKYDTTGIPDEYEVYVPIERAKNTYVFTERTRHWGPIGGAVAAMTGRKKREKANPRLIAKIDHECNVKPVRNEKYLKILQQRQLESSQTKRQIIQLEDTGLSRGQMAQLASGFSNASSSFGRGMVSRPNRLTAGERFVRLDRHDLTDRLFSLFSEKPYWGIPALKSTLKQPDVWLREVLKDVAEPIKEGQYTNMWALKDAWRVGVGVKGENGEGDGDGERKMETDLEDEGEDFEGEDFEGEDEGDDADLEEVLMS